MSTVCRVVPAGSLRARMKPVSPDEIASTVASTSCPAVAVNGMLATGCAAVILARGLAQRVAEGGRRGRADTPEPSRAHPELAGDAGFEARGFRTRAA